MKIPFLWISLSFALGILVFPYAHPYGFQMMVGVTALLPLVWQLRGNRIFLFFFCTIFFLFGILYTGLDQQERSSYLQEMVRAQKSGTFYQIEGTVVKEPEVKTVGKKVTVSFLLRASHVQGKGKHRKIRAENLQVFLHQPSAVPEINDEIRLWGQMKAPAPLMNPGGFNYQKYLKYRDVNLILNVYGKKSLTISGKHPQKKMDLQKSLSGMRLAIRRRIENRFSPEEASFVNALILGDRKSLSSKWKHDFFKTGTSHLLAVSGLNIALAAGNLYLLLILLRAPQKAAAVMAFFATWAQVLIAGYGIPVQRAGLMASMGFLGLLLEREKNTLNFFFLAGFMILLADTRALYSISFQLSFLSLFCLILYSKFYSLGPKWLEGLWASLAILIGTFPVVIYHFNTFSPVSVAANVVAIPAFHFVLLTSLLSLGFDFFPWMAQVFAAFCSFFLKTGLAWIHLCAQPSWGYFFIQRPMIWHLVFYYFCLGVMLSTFKIKMPFQKGVRIVGYLGFILSMAAFFYKAPGQESKLTLLSAGANEIAHIQFSPRNHWLINAGRMAPGNQAEWVVGPYLRSLGLKRIKGILFTDHRKRHLGGWEILKHDFRFDYWVFPRLSKQDPLSQGRRRDLKAGDRIRMPEGSEIEILSHAGGKMSFSVLEHGRRYLFLNHFKPAIFLDSGDIRADALILPSDISVTHQDFSSLLDQIRPKVIVSPLKKNRIPGIKQSEEILWLDLETVGALNFRAAEKNLLIESHLGETWKIQTRF